MQKIRSYDMYKPVLYVKNKLSKKPAQAVSSIEKVLQNHWDYNMSIAQNYSKNTVELDLLSRALYSPNCTAECKRNIYQHREVPATSAVKTYKKVVKEMFEAETVRRQEYLNSKPTLLDKFFDFLERNF